MSATTAIKNCAKCENTGIVNIPNGPDDFDRDYCTCYYGQQKEMLDDEELADAIEEIVSPACHPDCYQPSYSIQKVHDMDCPLFRDYSTGSSYYG